MTEAKFTSGPWYLLDTSVQRGLDIRGGAHHYAIAKANSFWRGPGPREDESIANAHLIAAAPDMYAALEAYAKAYDETSGTIHVNDKVRAALAKARGEVA